VSLAPLLCLHTLGIESHHVLISRGVMDFEFSLPLDGNYFIELTPPLLVQTTKPTTTTNDIIIPTCNNAASTWNSASPTCNKANQRFKY